MVSIIVAVANNGVIGREGGLPWNLPSELARFKKITMGHPVIMGRKTHESIGRTLPGRPNIVITRNPSYKPFEGSIVKHSLEEALGSARDEAEVFVIGGEALFEEALTIADKLYLTEVKATIKGDRFFNYDPDEWKTVSSEKHEKDEKNPYDFEFLELRRKKHSNTQTQ